MLLHCLETAVLFFVSLLGFSVNSYFVYKILSTRVAINSFQKLCFVKAFSNAVISLTIIVWAVPLSAFLIETNGFWRNVNVGISELVASGGYIFGPLCQILMAANRVIIMYFPFWRMKISRFPSTNVAVFVCAFVSLYCSVAGMRGKNF